MMKAMATSPKAPPPHRRSRSPKAAPEPPGQAARPFFRFYHSRELREKTLAVLERLEQAEDPTGHSRALAELVVELTNTGLEAYFLKPLSLAEAGFLVQKSAELGMAGAQQVMGPVLRNIIGRMDGPQLLSVCGSIRAFML